MTSTLLLVQFASQNIALFCCALFAGAATYLSLVEHPRLDEGEAELADTTLLASHPRPAIFQAALGVVGSLAAMLAGSAAGATWWLAGGAVLGAAALKIARSEEHTSELQSRVDLVCRLLPEKKKKNN